MPRTFTILIKNGSRPDLVPALTLLHLHIIKIVQRVGTYKIKQLFDYLYN